MQKIHSEIRRVDAEILTAVRQQVGISNYMFLYLEAAKLRSSIVFALLDC